MTDVVIAAIAAADLSAIVDIHTKAFPNSAITALGPEAVKRYYTWLLVGPHDAAMMGAWRGSRIVGFCAAGVYRDALSGFLRKNRAFLALHVATHPWLVFSPLVRQRMRRAAEVTIRFARRRPHVSAAVPAEKPFGILSIATDPDVRGSGVGRALMQDAEARARRGGFTKMVLTVHPSNEGAIKFYRDLGWEMVNAHTMDRAIT